MGTLARAPLGAAQHGASDLGARVWVAIPAAAYAIFIVWQGDWIFALGVLLLGFVCLHELFRMYDHVRPIRLAGFLGVIGLTAAAALRRASTRCCWPPSRSSRCVFLLALALPERTDLPLTAGMAITLLGHATGSAWRIAHAVLLRELPHGDGIVIAVLVGTFVGDTAAYLGGRYFGMRKLAPRISPNKTVEGLVFGVLGATLAVWCAGLYQDWIGGGTPLAARPRGRRRWRRSATSSSRRSSAMREPRTRVRCSVRTAARWTGWTPRCSRLVGGYYMWLVLM